ncbi:MAG: hypothetical protein RJB16_203, partial [Bacteroidota bacterium]
MIKKILYGFLALIILTIGLAYT